MDNVEQNDVAENNKVPETLDVVNPYDQAYIASLATVMWDDIDKYLSTAHQLYKDCNPVSYTHLTLPTIYSV